MHRENLTLDRLCLVVDSLDTAAEDFEHLGFTLTEEGLHSVGSRNRCIMLQGGQYIELLDPVTSVPNPVSDRYQNYLSRHGEGLAVVSLACRDADQLSQSWRESGLSPSPIRHFSRTVDLPTGSAEAEFRIVQLPEHVLPGMPHVTLIACQQMTPELVWLPGSTEHANGVRGITTVEFSSMDAGADWQVLRKIVSGDDLQSGADAQAADRVVMLGNARVVVRQRSPEHVGSSDFAVFVMDNGRVSSRKVSLHGINLVLS
ncbi:VOC family protein [Streptomyces sp. NPDC099088]|uniref:VOC family protein n=1 Tax=Streptomyces sp. NPDC099088 TaxID=3366101 RepID=UPI003821CDB2